ncbi:MAG: 4'-phosphopantetheinyl transferase superfamily protein [Streptomycetales bacterium]
MVTNREQRCLEATRVEEQAAAFTRIWTRKEALTKMTGDGLSAGLLGIEMSPASHPPRVLAWQEHPDLVGQTHLYDLDVHDSYRASLAVVESRPRRIVCRDVLDLLQAVS